MDGKQYTQKEVSEALARLNNEMEELVGIRKEINEQIRNKRNNIKFYENLDMSQYKAF